MKYSLCWRYWEMNHSYLTIGVQLISEMVVPLIPIDTIILKSKTKGAFIRILGI